MHPSPLRHRVVLGAPILAPVAAVLTLWLGHDPVSWQASQPLIHREADFVGALACGSCHPDQEASWRRTFHRTMTQQPTPGAIRGAFDGRTLSYQGQEARPYRSGDSFFLEIPDGRGGMRVAQVALAVGSRRYQQYFEKIEMNDGIAFRRLPFLWHIGAGRWLHLNTVFLGPDNPDWGKYRTLWNDNCVFCHNTGPRPGELFRISSAGERQFDPHLAELGIACEACHGPGREHSELYRDPVRRYTADGRDPRIVHPAKLDQQRAVSVCGQCHGQRTAADIRTLVGWLRTGPTFRSGDLLSDHAVSVYRDTPSPSDELPELFRQRFWADGTPRLTAYEYQGITQSPCYRRGSLTCESCHEMHSGDPEGILQPEMRGNAACTQCHAEIGAAVKDHTKHEPDGSGSACMDCHMPRVVYGILEVHRSHRIESPDPARDGEAGRPHACTLCHLDRSLEWAAAEVTRLWGTPHPAPRFRADGAERELPDALAALLSGDGVQRVVYARAAGRISSALAPEQKGEIRAALIATLGDAYPSIRWAAQRSLLELERELPLGLAPRLREWDHAGPPSTDLSFELLQKLGQEAPGRLASPSGLLLKKDFSPDLPAIVRLLRLQEDQVIDIGE